jgi:hypothetical protein
MYSIQVSIASRTGYMVHGDFLEADESICDVV